MMNSGAKVLNKILTNQIQDHMTRFAEMMLTTRRRVWIQFSESTKKPTIVVNASKTTVSFNGDEGKGRDS